MNIQLVILNFLCIIQGPGSTCHAHTLTRVRTGSGVKGIQGGSTRAQGRWGQGQGLQFSLAHLGPRARARSLSLASCSAWGAPARSPARRRAGRARSPRRRRVIRLRLGAARVRLRRRLLDGEHRARRRERLLRRERVSNPALASTAAPGDAGAPSRVAGGSPVWGRPAGGSIAPECDGAAASAAPSARRAASPSGSTGGRQVGAGAATRRFATPAGATPAAPAGSRGRHSSAATIR